MIGGSSTAIALLCFFLLPFSILSRGGCLLAIAHYWCNRFSLLLCPLSSGVLSWCGCSLLHISGFAFPRVNAQSRDNWLIAARLIYYTSKEHHVCRRQGPCVPEEISKLLSHAHAISGLVVLRNSFHQISSIAKSQLLKTVSHETRYRATVRCPQGQSFDAM